MAARLSIAMVLLALASPLVADDRAGEVDRLVNLLAEASADLRVQGLRDLAELGPEAQGACSRIAEMLDDTDALVRRQSLLTLAAVCPEPKAMAPRIVKMFVDQDIAFFQANTDIQCVMVRELPKFGTDLFPVLAAAAKQGLAGLNKSTIAEHHRARTTFFAEDNGNDCQLRREACIALGKLQDPRGAGVLLKVLESAERMRPARDPVGQALTVGRPPPWGQRHTLVVQSIVMALGDIPSDDPKVVSAIKKHARRFPRDTDAALRKIAERKKEN